jgi:hypothetical protein
MSIVTAATQRFSASDEALLFESIERWLRREVEPVVKKHDHEDSYPTEVVE